MPGLHCGRNFRGSTGGICHGRRLAGKTENGAKLSFSLLGIRIQPSEFIKITYLLFISGCIVTYRDVKGFLLASVGAAVHVLVLVFSRDLGTALIFVAAYVFVFFIAYKKRY